MTWEKIIYLNLSAKSDIEFVTLLKYLQKPFLKRNTYIKVYCNLKSSKQKYITKHQE